MGIIIIIIMILCLSSYLLNNMSMVHSELRFVESVIFPIHEICRHLERERYKDKIDIDFLRGHERVWY